MINYNDKLQYTGNVSHWLMGQTLHTEETESFFGYKGKGLKWGKIDVDIANDIDFLELWPDDKSIFEIPECVTHLPNLKALTIPSWFVSYLKENSFPESLEILNIGVGSEKKPKINWDKEKQFINIKYLDLNNVISDFHASNFPNLNKTLLITLGNKTLNLCELSKCEKLNNLFLGQCPDIKSLNSISNLNIRFLNLNSLKNTDFDGLSGFNNLMELDIRWSRNLFSLKGLECLQKLEKLEINGCSHLEDIGDIMSIPTLKWTLIISCGKNWTKNINEIISKFKKAGFQEVRYEPDGSYSLLEVFRN
jgi:hypothetical protein